MIINQLGRSFHRLVQPADWVKTAWSCLHSSNSEFHYNQHLKYVLDF
jgi:hypothetical protein